MQAEKWADLRNALIACLLAEPHRDRDEHPEAFEMKDFLIFEHPEFDSVKTDVAEAIEGEGEEESAEGWEVVKAYFTMMAVHDKHKNKQQGRKKNG